MLVSCRVAIKVRRMTNNWSLQKTEKTVHSTVVHRITNQFEHDNKILKLYGSSCIKFLKLY